MGTTGRSASEAISPSGLPFFVTSTVTASSRRLTSTVVPPAETAVCTPGVSVSRTQPASGAQVHTWVSVGSSPPSNSTDSPWVPST